MLNKHLERYPYFTMLKQCGIRSYFKMGVSSTKRSPLQQNLDQGREKITNH